MDDNLAEEEVQTQHWPVSLTYMEAKTLKEALAWTLAQENAKTQYETGCYISQGISPNDSLIRYQKMETEALIPKLVKLKTEALVDVMGDNPKGLNEMEAETLRKRQAKLKAEALLDPLSDSLTEIKL